MENRPVQFLYRDGDDFHFMDTDTYDQFMLRGEQLGESTKFMKDGMTLDRTSYQGETIGVELPVTIDLRVETTSRLAGDTARRAQPATTETGLVVQVPLFVRRATRSGSTRGPGSTSPALGLRDQTGPGEGRSQDKVDPDEHRGHCHRAIGRRRDR